MYASTLFISISHGSVNWSIEVHTYIFCVLWVNGAVFGGRRENTGRNVYTCTCSHHHVT